ncbi:hypothetical protein GCM10027298_26010 [Epidermidibacterium keratini]
MRPGSERGIGQVHLHIAVGADPAGAWNRRAIGGGEQGRDAGVRLDEDAHLCGRIVGTPATRSEKSIGGSVGRGGLLNVWLVGARDTLDIRFVVAREAERCEQGRRRIGGVRRVVDSGDHGLDCRAQPGMSCSVREPRDVVT